MATGFSLNTLRSNFQREWFRSFATGMGTGQGRAQRLCLGDLLVLAIARQLITTGSHPIRAFNAAYSFGVVAKTPAGMPRRLPFELFDRNEYDTLFVWIPDTLADVVPAPKHGCVQLEVLGLSPDREEATVCLLLNAIEAGVLKRVGLSPSELFHG